MLYYPVTNEVRNMLYYPVNYLKTFYLTIMCVLLVCAFNNMYGLISQFNEIYTSDPYFNFLKLDFYILMHYSKVNCKLKKKKQLCLLKFC